MTGAKVERTSPDEPERVSGAKRQRRGLRGPAKGFALFLGVAAMALVLWSLWREGRPSGVTIRVVDEAGAAVPGAFVRAARTLAISLEDLQPTWVQTDSDGRARLEGLDPGEAYALEVTPIDLPFEATGILSRIPTQAFDASRVAPWSPHDDVVLVHRNPRVVLRAVDVRDGRTPVPNAEFDVAEDDRNSRVLGTATAEGTLTVWMKPGTSMRLQAQAPGSVVHFDPAEWRTLTATSGEAIVPVDFPVDARPRRIVLHVENASPDAELTYQLRRQGKGTDPVRTGIRRGKADLVIDYLLPDEAYDVRVWDAAEESLGIARDLRPSLERKTVRLVPGPEVRGRLKGPVDLAKAQVSAVWLEQPDAVGGISAVPTSDGRFAFLHLRRGRWRIEGLAQGKERWLRVVREIDVGDTTVEADLAFE